MSRGNSAGGGYLEVQPGWRSALAYHLVFYGAEGVQPPRSTQLTCERFPYYTWTVDKGNELSGQFSLWEPDNCLCRWEWLANDLFFHWLQADKAP